MFVSRPTIGWYSRLLNKPTHARGAVSTLENSVEIVLFVGAVALTACRVEPAAEVGSAGEPPGAVYLRVTLIFKSNNQEERASRAEFPLEGRYRVAAGRDRRSWGR